MAEIFWKKSYFEIGSRFGGNALFANVCVWVTFFVTSEKQARNEMNTTNEKSRDIEQVNEECLLAQLEINHYRTPSYSLTHS